MTPSPVGRPLAVALVDYGMGNLASVAKALQRVGAEVTLVTAPERLRSARAIVLPGVGAFRDAAEHLRTAGLADAVVERIEAGIPFLGVCLGLQLLFERSAEGGGDWPGLGVFPGSVERLKTNLKVPHIGWNELEWREAVDGMTPSLPSPAYVYFVHSYAAGPADPGIIAATTQYGGEVVAAVARDNVWAMQFHPEKSSQVGMRLLTNFLTMATDP